MSIPVWEVLEGHANTVEGQEHKPYRDIVNGSGQPLDLVGVMRECAAILREDYERRCVGRQARDAVRVPPQADSIHFFRNKPENVEAEDSPIHHVPQHMRESTFIPGMPRTHATEPLVTPERRIDILSFRNALERICEAYGVKIKGDTDASGDILIYDQRQKLPHGYDWSAYIEPNGQMEFCDYVLDDESGATKQ